MGRRKKVVAEATAATAAKIGATGGMSVAIPASAQAEQLPPWNAAPRRLKIVVYAIAKNEEKFVARWMDSMKEADAICVLDTGSFDTTVPLLRERGAKVETRNYGDGFRFDVARNDSLAFALKCEPDADLLVCTDLDETFVAGWRERLEAAWLADCDKARREGLYPPTTAQYEYVWNFRADGSDGTKFWYEKIHTPQSGAKWKNPVHETLTYPSAAHKTVVRVEGLRLEHRADPTKSRGQYLRLLELGVQEEPTDARRVHYLGREYLLRGMWDRCIETLKPYYFALPSATSPSERAQSMRFVAKCYGEKGDAARQEVWLRRAVDECATQREAALDLAELMYRQKDWPALVRACERCLSVKERTMSHVTSPEAWGFRPHDLLALGLWNLGRGEEALAAVEEAVARAPDNARLLKNRQIMRDALKKDEGAVDGAGG